MKIVKALLFLFVITGFQQMNGQTILNKWEDLSNFSQVLDKVNYVADQNKFDLMDRVSPILVEYADKLDLKNVPAKLGTPKVAENIALLKTQSKSLNDLTLSKSSKEAIQTALNQINATYKEIIALCKID